MAWSEKAGSRSIEQKLRPGKNPRITLEGAVRSKKIMVLFIRHPIERFASAWAYFFARERVPPDRRLRKLMSVEAFTDAVLDQKVMNAHWQPQSELHTDRSGLFVPSEIHAFDNIAAFWHELCDYPLPHLNAGPGRPEIIYRLEDLAVRYQHDLALWGAAKTRDACLLERAALASPPV